MKTTEKNENDKRDVKNPLRFWYYKDLIQRPLSNKCPFMESCFFYKRPYSNKHHL